MASKDFLRQFLLDMNIVKDTWFLNDMKYSMSYNCSSDTTGLYIDVYKISGHSLIFINMIRKGQFIKNTNPEDKEEFIWVPAAS